MLLLSLAANKNKHGAHSSPFKFHSQTIAKYVLFLVIVYVYHNKLIKNVSKHDGKIIKQRWSPDKPGYIIPVYS